MCSTDSTGKAHKSRLLTSVLRHGSSRPTGSITGMVVMQPMIDADMRAGPSGVDSLVSVTTGDRPPQKSVMVRATGRTQRKVSR